MKQWIVFLAAAILVAALPTQGMDVAKLQPVELIYVYMENNQITLRTDTGDLGQGMDLNAAMKNLKQTTAAEVFLDTADYLVVTEETKQLLPELAQVLKGKCRVCRGDKLSDLEQTAAYLSAHKSEVRLKDCTGAAGELPVLTEIGGRLCLSVGG